MTVLLCEEQGFLLHRQASVDLAQNRQILTAVAQDTRFNGMLAVRYIIPAIAKADLRLIRRIFVEVFGNQFNALALDAPLVQLTRVDQLAAMNDHHLVRRCDMKGSGEVIRSVFQAHLISSLIRQMYFSASSRISVTCCLRFGIVSKVGLKVKLYSSR